MVKIYAIAAQHGIRVCPHRGAEVWGLHAIAAFEPADPLAETGRHWLSWVKHQPPISDGIVTVPDRPGFGIELDLSDGNN